MNETMVTVIGNVTNDPTLRATSGGTRVTSFRLAATERRYDKSLGAWRDGDTVFWGVSCWRGLAEHVADSVTKGQPVMVFGRLRQRDYELDGQRRTSLEIDALAVGHDLTRGVARFERARRAEPGEPVEAGDRSLSLSPVDTRPAATEEAGHPVPTAQDGSAA
jgi:single-strand DNA-binding protein